MIKLFIGKILILLALSLSLHGYASVTKVKYEGGISLYGKVAEADIVLEKNPEKGTYKMKILAASIGLVKKLTSNRVDTFVSEGRIVDGVYMPSKFTKTVTKDNYLKKITYTFDYKKDRILKETYLEELKDESYYDIVVSEIVEEERLVKSTKKKFLEMKHNDFISLYLNLSAGNIKVGDVTYVDQKDSDVVSLMSANSFEVSKNDAEDVYRINLSKSGGVFFAKAVAVDIGFYGDAYVKKVSEYTSVLN